MFIRYLVSITQVLKVPYFGMSVEIFLLIYLFDSSIASTFYQNYSYGESADEIGGKLVLSQSILSVSVINSLVAFNVIHETIGELLFFSSILNTTRDK
jgi:hypothetical protein